MTPEQANEIMGSRLGRNPLGQPLYKWIHSDSWMHLMKIHGKTKEVMKNGLWVVEPVFEPRKMCDLVDIWVLAHWHDREPEHVWALRNPNLLWPREGYYAPTNIVLGQGEALSATAVEEAVVMIRKQAQKSYADLLRESERIEERKEKHRTDAISDEIDDCASAFYNIPGTRSAHVSFGGIDKPTPAAAA